MKCFNTTCIDTDEAWDHECLEDIGCPMFCKGFMPEPGCEPVNGESSGAPLRFVVAR